jgi:acylphosphatase
MTGAVRATRCWRVSGHVQGVFFRASTRAEALRLGLDGSAVNLADGGVEVIASGPPEALLELEAWLRRGPPQARVDAIEPLPAPASVAPGFATG